MIFAKNTVAPGIDTLEVSLFGYGVGESLAIHVGNGDWILVDLVDVVVHVMKPDAREFYSLERLWTIKEPNTERREQQ